jgi:Bacterial Ig domain
MSGKPGWPGRRESAATELHRGARRDRDWSRRGHVSRHRLRPAILVLEDRRLLSTFTVTSTADTAPANNPTQGTLRWAVEQADESATGATINFSLSTPATITLGQGPLNLSNLGGAFAVNGPGAGLLTVSGGGQSQVFTSTEVEQGGQTLSMSGLTISGGSTTGQGAGLFSLGSLTLTGVTISGNTAGTNGGGVYNRGFMTLLNCTLSGNSAATHGGAMDNAGTATLIDCTIANNTTGPTGVSGGGGLDNEKAGTLSLVGCSISGNSSGQLGLGAGLLNYGLVGLADCAITGNTAKTSGSGSSGGGLDNEGTGTANLTDCTLTGNYAHVGGGLNNFLKATANLTDCVLSKNTAYYSAGLNSAGPVNLTNCTISGNTATGPGGGLNVGPGLTNLTNCTIYGNAAASGGGLVNYGPANLTACTISGNTATTAAGIDNVSAFGYTGTAVLTDTIVAGNTAPGGAASDIGGNNAAGVTGTNNVVGTGSSGGITGGVSGNQVGVTSAGLAALAANGGLTQTMALKTGSPAIGAGVAVTGLTTDQRGLPRPTSGAVDVGAFETQSVADSPPIASYEAVTTNENAALAGQVSATDADSNPLTYSVVAQPADGTVAIQSNGLFTYTPTANWSGPDSFTFRAFDGIAYSNVATVSVVVYPVTLQPPVANNDTYATPQNTALVVSAPGVLANDTDPLNRTMTAVLVGGGPFHGSLNLNSDGSFTYTPAANFFGTDTFTYEASAGQLDSQIATVTLSVGAPPLAVNDSYSVVANASLMAGEGPTFVTMVSQPGDFVGQGLSYTFGGTITAKVLNSGVTTNAVEIDISAPGQTWTLDFAAPNQGQLVVGTYTGATRWPVQAAGVPGLDVSGDGRGANMLTGQFTVTQAVYDASGNIVSFVASFVQYADGSNASLSGQIEFNDTLGQPSGVLANDTDPIPGTTLTAVMVNGPSHGTIAFNSDGSFSYVPAGGFVGIDSFTYQDNVGTLVGNLATVTLGVFTPPIAINDSYSAAENGTLTVAAPGVLANDSDPNNLPLTAVLGAGPVDGTLALNKNGSFTYTPAKNFTGTDGFSYFANDGYFQSKTTVAITVVQAGQASLVKKDATTAGNWIGTYGSQGYDVIASAIQIPSYATLTGSGESLVTWAASTTDPRALQQAGGSGRIAAGWYSSTGFTINVNISDGNTHNLELYFLDWDTTTRAEQVQISDATSGTILDTEKVSSFHSGVYLDWKVSGAIAIKITKTAGANAVLSGIFFDSGAPTKVTPTITWANPADIVYGTALSSTQLDASANVAGSFAYAPASGTVLSAGKGQSLSVTFTPTDTTDYSTATATALINVLLATPTITWANPANIVAGTALSSTQLDASSSWTVGGVVGSVAGTFNYTPAAGTVLAAGNNQTLSVTFTPTETTDFTSATGSATINVTATSSSATFLQRDTTTEGNWIGAYGSDAYEVIANATKLPSYATVTPSGQSNVTWTTNTTDPRALQQAGGSGRIAAGWYSSTGFTINVNISDGNTHNLELYFLDWDTTTRAEQVQISDAVTGTILDTEKVSSFHSGVYLDWKVSGAIAIKITKTAGANAVLSGIFFDPPPALPMLASAGFALAPGSGTPSVGIATLSTLATSTSATGTLDARIGHPVAVLPAPENSPPIRELVRDVALEQVSVGRRSIRSLLGSAITGP